MAEKRKLAAILAADVVGFSRLTSADEDHTLARLRALRSYPTLRLTNLSGWLSLQRPQDALRWAEGLRKAGTSGMRADWRPPGSPVAIAVAERRMMTCSK